MLGFVFPVFAFMNNAGYGNLATVLCSRNILLQMPKPLPIQEKSRVLGCQTLHFADAAFASPLTWGKLDLSR
ncbi:hypothetical protein BCV64_14355 [Cylindrospermopsis raciborskii MVCC14]|nr:hypothetical protein BCV64_14355 [Cylindrospermopsis raciborskii MVCC14]